MKTPSPDTVRTLRTSLQLTQKEAADLAHVSTRAWQWWESGKREMPISTWELLVIKAGIHPIYKPQKIN
jgi:DNA-binding transcriptional regulator YiaG